MTSDELMALTRRMLDQLELRYVENDDGSEVAVDTDDGQPLFITTLEVQDSKGDTWPVLFLYSAVLVVDDTARLNRLSIGELNNDLVIGKLAVVDAGEAVALTIQHECVGWPGAAELRVTWEQMLTQASGLREELLEPTGGSMPSTFAELGS